jgi:hypothetical protein
MGVPLDTSDGTESREKRYLLADEGAPAIYFWLKVYFAR